jgi:MOSC domain-containing protein YiiM
VAGRVESIWVASTAGAAPVRVESVRVEPGRGLEGDRYAEKRGTYSTWPGAGREVTLIAAEAIEAVEAELGVRLDPGSLRRNVVVRSVDLDALIGHELAIGEVRLRGVRPCEPCAYLAKLLGEPRLLKALVGRGGLRCDVVLAGTIRAGDRVG